MPPERLARGDAPSKLRAVGLPGREGAYDVELSEARIARVARVNGMPTRLVLPAFSDPHVHVDRAFLTPPRPPTSLVDAIEIANRLRGAASVEDIRGRAVQFLGRALTHGSLHVRTHVDVDDVVGERALEAVLAAREELADRLDLELVAFATSRLDPATDEGRRRLTRAAELGATYLGAVIALYPDPVASIRAVLDLAVELDCDVDLHVDETSAPDRIWLEDLADATFERGLRGRVFAGHCCALAAAEPADAARIIDKVARAGITVISLPACNLYLQDRGRGTPRRRGMTLITELLAAGVAVRLGTDNAREVFIPYGDADPLDNAFLAAIAAHVDDDLALLRAIADGKCDLAPGDEASLVVLDSSSLRDAISVRPRGRTVLRRGVVVSAAC